MGPRFLERAWLLLAAVGLVTFVVTRLSVPSFDKLEAEIGLAALGLLASVPAVLGAVRHRDPVRIWLAAGTVLWTVASAVLVALFLTEGVPSYPAPPEALWILSYVCFIGAMLTTIGRHARTRDPGRWLDALVAVVATAAFAVVAVRPWSAGPGLSPLGQATVGTYFVLDVLMLGTALAGILLTGARPVRVWRLLGGAVVLMSVTDLVYGLRIADPSSAAASILDAGWPLALLGFGAFAFSPPVPAPRRPPVARHMPVLPIICSVAAIGALVYDHYATISDAGLWLTVVTLVIGLVRTVLVMQANVALAETRRQALTDDLTGLGNRRRLYRDLDTAVSGSRAATLALFDLDGFKTYNDSRGHVAGDGLLSELSERLTDAIGADAVAYRLGGDEFCVLASGHPASQPGVIDRALTALRADGVSASGGAVSVPFEATDASEALRIADMRMYADKALRRTAAEAAAPAAATA